MLTMGRIGALVAFTCAVLIAALFAQDVLAGPAAGDLITPPTSTRTPPVSTAPTRTPTPRGTPTRTTSPTNTPAPAATPRVTSTSLPVAPNPTPPPGIATLPPPPPPLVVPSATNTPLSLTVPTPEPTDFPIGVPPATSTPPSFTTGAVPDLVATGIEVTQGMQNLDNDMPLVEARLTVARVYVKTQDPAVPAANVKGVLAAFRNGQHLGLAYPENGPIAAVADGGLRTNVDDSLYFYLPDSWTTGEVTLRTFVYSTTPDAPYDQEPDEENNFADVTVEFHAANPLKVRLVPLHTHDPYDANGTDMTYHYNNHQSEALQIIVDMLRLHPISTNGLQWYASSTLVLEDQGPGITIQVSSVKPVGHQDGVEWDLTGTDKSLANERIKFFKVNSPEPYDEWHWYGMVDSVHCLSVSCGITGWASDGVSLGKMDPTTPDAPWDVIGGFVLSHEIAHLLLAAPDHIGCTGGETGQDPAYPYQAPNCSLAAIDPDGWYGFDVYWPLWGNYLDGPMVISNDPAAPWPNQAFPLMGAKSPQYTDPWNYCRLLDSHGIPCDHLTIGVSIKPRDSDRFVSVAASQFLSDPYARATHDHALHDHRSPAYAPSRQPAASYAYVSALVDATAGTGRIVEVMPLEDVSAGALAEAQARDAEAQRSSAPPEFELVLENVAGDALVSYPIRRGDLSHEEPEADGGWLFAGLVEYPDATAAVRVRRAGTVLAERLVSANAPVVRVLSPNGGEQLSGRTEVRWEAADADGDSLVFTIMYSADGGDSWSPIAADLRGDTATLASTEGLAGGERALFRVIANDGMRTAFDDSDAVFAVPDIPPEAHIVGPMDGMTFPQGATVTLLGSAYDTEDGALTGDNLRWASSLDGDLGSGTDVRARDLQPGAHVVTLLVTDSEGGSAEQTIRITIGASRPDQPDQPERDRAANLLLNGRPEGDGTSWLIIGLGAAAAGALVLAGAAFARVRLARRQG